MPPTIGDRLKQSREQRGLSLADVAHTTRVPIARLHDLEQNVYTNFGSIMYAKSFLQAYANLLNVDASEVLDQFQRPPLGGEQDYKYLTRSYGQWIRPRRAAPVEYNTQMMQPSRSFAVVAMVCGVVMLLGVGMLLGNAWLGNKQPDPEPTVTKAIPFDAAAQAAAEAAAKKRSWNTSTETAAAQSPPTEIAPAVIPQPETTTLRAEVYRPPEDVNIVPPKAIPVDEEAPRSKSKSDR